MSSLAYQITSNVNVPNYFNSSFYKDNTIRTSTIKSSSPSNYSTSSNRNSSNNIGHSSYNSGAGSNGVYMYIGSYMNGTVGNCFGG